MKPSAPKSRPGSKPGSTPDARPGSDAKLGPEQPRATITMVPLCSVFRRYLKNLDLKYTTERADILDAVIRLDRLFEAEELLAYLESTKPGVPTSSPGARSPGARSPGARSPGARSPGSRSHKVSKATMYRTLKLLVEAGILAELQLDRERTHYQLAYGKPPTDFAICVESGTRVEFTNPRVTELCNELMREMGWTPLSHRLQLYGVAPKKPR